MVSISWAIELTLVYISALNSSKVADKVKENRRTEAIMSCFIYIIIFTFKFT